VNRFIAQLFGLDRDETRGDVLRFKLLEAFLLSYAVYWAWTWGAFIQKIPSVVAPRGFARDLDLSFLVGTRLGLLNAAIISVCAAAVLFQRGSRLAMPLLIVLLHVQYVARHCLGKVAHGSHYVGLGLLMLAVSVWCMRSATSRRRFAFGATVLFMGAGYMSAGISKLATAGPTWPDGRHLWLWIGEKSVDQLANLGHFQLNALQRLCLDHWWLATGLLIAGLATELSGFLLWFRTTRTLVTLALVGLHLSVFWSMGILFDAYVYQLLIVGLPLPRLIDFLLGRIDARRAATLSLRAANASAAIPSTHGLP
jgi:hypothetical protein